MGHGGVLLTLESKMLYERRRATGFLVTVVSLPVTSYRRRSTGVESTRLVTGLPYGSRASISAVAGATYV